MKIKLRKVLPRLLALFLILSMMLTPNVIEVLADGESGTGSTNPNYKGDPGTFEYDKNLTAVFKPAWLVYIQKVDNTCDGSDIFDYSATNIVNPDSQCKRSVVDAMLWNYPEDYRRMDNTLAERSFIVVDKGTEPALPFKLTAHSSQTEVEPGSKVAATINIDLKQTNKTIYSFNL